MKKLAIYLMLALFALTSCAAYAVGFHAAVHMAEPRATERGTIEINYGGNVHEYR